MVEKNVCRIDRCVCIVHKYLKLHDLSKIQPKILGTSQQYSSYSEILGPMKLNLISRITYVWDFVS